MAALDAAHPRRRCKVQSGFDWLSHRYGSTTVKLVHRSTLMLLIYGGLLGLTVWRLNATPTGFIPDQDQGFLLGVIQLPPGASLERTEAAVEKYPKGRRAEPERPDNRFLRGYGWIDIQPRIEQRHHVPSPCAAR